MNLFNKSIIQKKIFRFGVAFDIQEGTAFHSGQRFANFFCTSFKTNIYRDTEGVVYHRKVRNMS